MALSEWLLIFAVLVVIGEISWHIYLHTLDERDERQQRKAEEEAARQAEELRLAPKRRELGRLKAHALGRRDFLDPDYRERYAFEHYDEVRKQWPQMLREYDEWEGDPDFPQLVKKLNLGDMLRVWAAKRQVKAFADGLTMAERRTWDAREARYFSEAHARGVTVEQVRKEHRGRQKKERESEPDEEDEGEPDVLSLSRAERDRVFRELVRSRLRERERRKSAGSDRRDC